MILKVLEIVKKIFKFSLILFVCLSGLMIILPILFFSIGPVSHLVTSPQWENVMQEILPDVKVEIISSSHMNSSWGNDYTASFLFKIPKEEDQIYCLQRIKEFNDTFTGKPIIYTERECKKLGLEDSKYFTDETYCYQFTYLKRKDDYLSQYFTEFYIGRDGHCYVTYTKLSCEPVEPSD